MEDVNVEEPVEEVSEEIAAYDDEPVLAEDQDEEVDQVNVDMEEEGEEGEEEHIAPEHEEAEYDGDEVHDDEADKEQDLAEQEFKEDEIFVLEEDVVAEIDVDVEE